MTRALMLQGTGSGVGKSLLTAGLCRAFLRRGLRVRPFKPQNMSNNAAVVEGGGEIGRAQALQAQACGVPPSVHMNPVLLKPQGGDGASAGAQVVVHGRVHATARAREYQARKRALMPAGLDSFARLSAEADLVLVEGAGSASEVNLRANDIANMGFARATGTPVVIVGDIDRGGVIASLVGTHAVLDPDDRALVRGFIVNRMRGDPTLFAEGMDAIARHTGWAALGLVPFLDAARRLPAEDAADLDDPAAKVGRTATLPDAALSDAGAGSRLRIAVPLLPRIANFDDLDPLAAEPGVELLLLRPGTPVPAGCDLVILPGSKATLADLASLRAAGWDIDIAAHRRRGGRVLGLCGGYQMLGRTLSDPDGIEGPPATAPGLGLLDVETMLAGDKRLAATDATTLDDGVACRGYEMHMGRTDGPDATRPMLRLRDGRSDGARSVDGLVCGTYLHGLFAGDAQRSAWLHRLGAPASTRHHAVEVEAALDALAGHLERHVDIDRLLSLAG